MPQHTLISIVEDDEPFRESMRKLLMALGYTVEAFPSVADFLASASGQKEQHDSTRVIGDS